MVNKGKELVSASTRQAIDSYFARGLARLSAAAVESVRTGRIGVTRTRFKEGFTTEEQFIQELRLLRVSDEELKLELAAARLDYATDYLKDLISAYREAARKGHISIDQYRERLTELGLVPERAAALMLLEVARLKPEALPTAIAPPKPYYETDAGKIAVDTIRRERRKLLISRDQEIAALLEVGMPVDQATAAANNDDVRLAEKGAEE
uniref:Uncharacterized protein n=1 Tax=viral metagenome TaxID=1070528 RepID=A0A6H1ZR42_9ZZZZ